MVRLFYITVVIHLICFNISMNCVLLYSSLHLHSLFLHLKGPPGIEGLDGKDGKPGLRVSHTHASHGKHACTHSDHQLQTCIY